MALRLSRDPRLSNASHKPSQLTTPADPQGSKSAPAAKLGSGTGATIGQQLRLMYGEVINQGVPDRFAGILGVPDDPTDDGAKNGPS